MRNRTKYLAFITLAALLISSAAGCTSTAPAATAARTRIVQVQRGDLDVTVSVDGNLVMPEAFNLHFGAAGDVKDVYVKEGDRVRAGAILARLDDTAQRLDIKSSVNSMQSTLSNLYETVPRLPQFPTTFYDVNTTTTTVPDHDSDWLTGWHDSYTDVTSADYLSVHNWVYGTYKIRIPETTTTKSNIIEKPRWDWVWDDVNDEWMQDPALASPFLGLPVGYPAYYANSMALTAYGWADEEVIKAQELFLADNRTAAASQLYIALADLESSLRILEDAVLNPASGLGNIQDSVPQDPSGYINFQVQQGESFAVYYIGELRSAMSSVKAGQDEIARLRDLVTQGEKEQASALFENVLARMQEIGKTVMKNINVIRERSDCDVYGKDISDYLYTAASEKLDAALKGIEEDGISSPGLADNLVIARHYMMLCNAILGTNEYVLQHGLSLKAENQYKIELENRMIDLSNKRDNFLKTVIMTPVDGIVVSVGVKKNDVLSAQDYSSKGTIQVVDTSQIKFTGTVDEIDIIKIKTGQSASVLVDAIPNRTFPGKVSFISPFGSASTGGVVKFNVTILLDPTDIDIKGGLTATADIAVKRIENALLLPVTAVTTTQQGSFVSISTDNATTTEKRPVTLGERTQQFIQILSGVQEGDSVVITERAVGVTTTNRMGPPPGAGGPPPR